MVSNITKKVTRKPLISLACSTVSKTVTRNFFLGLCPQRLPLGAQNTPKPSAAFIKLNLKLKAVAALVTWKIFVEWIWNPLISWSVLSQSLMLMENDMEKCDSPEKWVSKNGGKKLKKFHYWRVHFINVLPIPVNKIQTILPNLDALGKITIMKLTKPL